MSKFEDELSKYKANIEKYKIDVDFSLVEKVAKKMGPSIYKKDASSVACSDNGEKKTVINNFLKKKLSLTEDDSKLMDAINKVCKDMDASNKTKYRPIFYTLLLKEFGKESLYS